MTTYFCDGLREVTILNGVARLEFHQLEPVAGIQNREMRTVGAFSVALPVPGLVAALAVFDQLRDQLVQEGILQPAAEIAAPVPLRGRSPNFS
jgi:hypothetical protein